MRQMCLEPLSLLFIGNVLVVVIDLVVVMSKNLKEKDN
jgi:hypothetical protein